MEFPANCPHGLPQGLTGNYCLDCDIANTAAEVRSARALQRRLSAKLKKLNAQKLINSKESKNG